MNRESRPPLDLPGGPEPDPDLEAFLVRTRFRQPPTDWRESILAKALSPTDDAAATVPADLGSVVTGIPRPNGAHRERFASASSAAGGSRASWWERWRSGWTVLAAAWGLVLCLNQYATPRVDHPPARRPPWSDRALAEIRAQQAMLAEVTEGTWREPSSGATRERDRDRDQDRRPAVARPRAERQIRERGELV